MEKFCFDQVAEIYDDYYQTDLGFSIDVAEKRKMKEFLPFLKGKNILEIGCGTGHWTEFFTLRGYSVHGIDVSEKMLEKARSKNIPDATFSLMSAEKLSFEDDSIDNIVAITSLEFVEKLEKAITEIKRVLKPSGTFMLACLNINSPIGKSKAENELFTTAHFFSANELYDRLSIFGDVKLDGCCIIKDDKVADLEEDYATIHFRIQNACMLIAAVKNEKI